MNCQLGVVSRRAASVAKSVVSIIGVTVAVSGGAVSLTALLTAQASAQSNNAISLPTVQVVTEAGSAADTQGYVTTRTTTATKTDTPWIETPQAVTTVGAEQIRDQQPAKFDEVARYAPGVKGELYGPDARNDWFLIRGFKSDNDGIFLDGLQLYYTAYGSFKVQPFGLERVDLLRGPSSALFGSGSPGGVINAVSKRPSFEPIRYLEVGINNYGNRYVNFDFSGAVPSASGGKSTVAYRLTGSGRAGDTQTDYVEDDNYFIAPALTWQPNLDTKLTILSIASHNVTKGGGFLPYAGTVTAAPFGRISTSTYVGEPGSDAWRRTQAMTGYQFEHAINNTVTFRQNARYAYVDVYFPTYFSVGYLNQATGVLARGGFFATAKAGQANLDNQFEGKFNTGPFSHTVLVGLDVKHYHLDDYQAFGGGPSISVVNPVYSGSPVFSGAPYRDADLTLVQAGVYIQDQIKFDRWTLVVSGRRDEVNTKDDNHIGADKSRSDGKSTGRIGLIYTSAIGLAPYVSYATSFTPVIGTNTTTGDLFFPETAKQAEVGVKYQPTWINGTFGVAVFDLRRQNVQTTDPANPLLTLQTGEIRSRGFELEAAVNPLPGLKIVGAYTAYQFETTADLNPANIGKTLPAVPEQFASLWGDYTIQSGPFAGLGFGLGVRYVGSSWADTLNTLSVPAYTLFDAAIHYERNGWRYAINAVNLGDKTYVASCSSVNACFYGERLRVTGSVSYKW